MERLADFCIIHDAKAVLIANAQQNIEWWQAIAELIDNAFDAGALRVEVSLSGKTLVVTDDGRGCKDLRRMLALGSHYDQGGVTQPVGMWGVGLKDAWMFCGERIEVESVHKGVLSKAAISLADVQSTGFVPGPVVEATDREQGTSVRLPLKATRRSPRQETWRKLSWVFTPAMQSQRQIIVGAGHSKRNALKPIQLPPFAKAVEETFEVGGRSVAINIGIIKDGAKMLDGPFWLSYGHRNIDGSSLGSNGWCTLRMGGTIALGKGWVLRKNKDDLSECKEELEAAIFERIGPLLEEHAQLAEDVESAQLRETLEGMINDSLTSIRKENRNAAKHETGRVLPANTGRTRTSAAKSSDDIGSVIAGRGERRRGFRINWEDEESDRIGRYDQLSKEVRLNIGNPFVAKSKAAGNLPALYACAVALFCHTETIQEGAGQRLLIDRKGSFHDNYGRVMKSLQTGSGESNGH